MKELKKKHELVIKAKLRLEAMRFTGDDFHSYVIFFFASLMVITQLTFMSSFFFF